MDKIKRKNQQKNIFQLDNENLE